jgi:hypothetical protein
MDSLTRFFYWSFSLNKLTRSWQTWQKAILDFDRIFMELFTCEILTNWLPVVIDSAESNFPAVIYSMTESLHIWIIQCRDCLSMYCLQADSLLQIICRKLAVIIIGGESMLTILLRRKSRESGNPCFWQGAHFTNSEGLPLPLKGQLCKKNQLSRIVLSTRKILKVWKNWSS